jgi:hypothetical protein
VKKTVIVTETDQQGLIASMLEAVGLGPDTVEVLQYNGVRYNQMAVLRDLGARAKTAERIICLGSAALEVLIPAKVNEKAGKLRADTTMEWQDIPVYMSYSLQYLEKRGGRGTPDYQIVTSDIARFCAVSKKDEDRFVYRTYRAHEYVDFMRDYKDAELVALDYEGSSLEPAIAGFEVGGVGLARPGRDGQPGAAGYLVFKDYGDLSYKLTPAMAVHLGRFLAGLEKRATILAFNLKYEVPLTRAQFKQSLTKIVDVMQEMRTLDETGGLKDISKRVLGVYGWTKDLDEWLDTASALLAILKPTAKNPRAEWKPFLAGGVEAVLEFLEANATKIKKSKNADGTTSEASVGYNTRTAKVRELILSMLEMSRRFYTPEESVAKLNAFIAYKFERRDYECNYTEVPVEIVGPYCGADCYNTIDVHAHALKRLAADGLEKAAGYYNQHIYLGAKLELNGIRWDDDVAARVEAEHSQVMVDSLKGFLLSAHVRKALQIKVDDKSDEVRHLHQQDVLDIQSAVDVDTLKRYFNPDSTQPANTVKLGFILVTPIIRITLMLQELSQQYQSDARAVAKQYPTLLRLLNRILSVPQAERGRQTVVDFAGAMRKLVEAEKLTDAEHDLYRRYAAYTLPDATGESIQVVMDSLTVFTGADLDNRDSWIPEVYPVFYYKLYKKVSKALSAFVNGAGGRKSVRIVRYNRELRYYERVAFYGDEVEFRDEDLDLEYVAGLLAKTVYAEVVPRYEDEAEPAEETA